MIATVCINSGRQIIKNHLWKHSVVLINYIKRYWDTPRAATALLRDLRRCIYELILCVRVRLYIFHVGNWLMAQIVNKYVMFIYKYFTPLKWMSFVPPSWRERVGCLISCPGGSSKEGWRTVQSLVEGWDPPSIRITVITAQLFFFLFVRFVFFSPSICCCFMPILLFLDESKARTQTELQTLNGTPSCCTGV